MKYKVVVVLGILFLFCTGCNSTLEPMNDGDDYTIKSTSEVPSGVVCSVNGEYIFHSDIEDVYNQFNGEYSYSKILGDSILEVLAIQLAPEYGLTVTNDEVESAIEIYKNQYPTFYEAAMEVNTTEEFRNKIETNLLFSKVKEYVCNHVISDEENITQSELLEFEQKYGLVEHLEEYSDTTNISSLWSDIQSYLFLEWGDALKREAEIVFYNPDDTTTDFFRFNELSSGFSGENERLYFDPNSTYEEEWTFEKATAYIGYDFRPSYIPKGLKCIIDYDKDYKFTTVYNSDNSIAYDILTINYEEDFETSEPQESTLTVQVSKQEIWTDAPVTADEKEKISIIGGVEVALAEKELPYGPYIETVDGEKVPSGYYSMLVGQFYQEGIYYRITASNIEKDEFIKVLYSIIEE